MIDYEHKELFMQDSIEKQLTISYGNVVITNEDLFNQEMTLEESLCSDQQLTFGSCEASIIKFKVANIVAPVKNQWITVKMTLEGNDGNQFSIGKYKVESDKPTADRKWREIVAYDAMYDIINADVIGWYNKAFPNAESTMTIKQLRHSFFEHFGIVEADISLVNDNEVIGKTWKSEELSGKTVINAICEINGCFGHIGRDGLFHYIYLVQGMQGLYPRNDIFPADNIYPRDPKSTPIPKNLYISCTYEDFNTGDIGKVQIINGDSGTVSVVGSGDNCYTIESNFLVTNKTQAEFDRIGEGILEKIRGVTYRPFEVECLGNPCFEVGDPVRLSTTYDIVESYILKRTLKGIQALRDSYSSEGVEKYEIRVNSTERAVGQLNDKTDALEEDVGIINNDIDTINDEIEDINENVGELHISLQRTESGLQAEVSRAKTAEGDLSSRINMTDSEISAEVTRAKGAESNLSSRITMTANDITAEVSRATAAEGNLSSRITINANGISTKVTKGDVVSEINQSPEKITLNANRLIVNSTNFSLDANGNATFGGQLNGASGTFSGSLTSPTVNFYGLFSYNGKWQLDSVSNNALYVRGGHIDIDGGGYLISDKITSRGGVSAYGIDSNYLTVSSSAFIQSLSSPTITSMQAQIDSLISSSDSKLKYDVKDISEGFAEVLIDGAMPKEYRMKNLFDKSKHLGMIAQDVNHQLCGMGIVEGDYFLVNKMNNGYYGIGYMEYIPIIIKYCQILKREIKELRKLINVGGN